MNLPVSAESRGPSEPIQSREYKFPAAKHAGSLSCASASCHGGSDSVRAGSEYTTWVNSDPHFRAYVILLDPPSRKIAENLKLSRPAHESELCLKCHAPSAIPVHVSPLDRPVLPGVGCEQCHGPAEKYLSSHYQNDFKKLTRSEKADAYGLFPTKDLAFRVSMCASCHVGDESREVNHDMIAAGHPRLAFEYTGYHHSKKYKRHWEESEYGPDFDARAWEIGQVASARAAVALTGIRAERAKARLAQWPELSEYSCYSCHKDLKPGESWKPFVESARPPGAMPWGTWYFSTADLATADPDAFQRAGAEIMRLMEAPAKDSTHTAERCKKLAEKLDSRLNHLQNLADADSKMRPYDAAYLERSFSLITRHALTSDGTKFRDLDWDGATQHYLAAAAQYYSLGEVNATSRNPRVREPLVELGSLLEFPKMYNSPKGRDPAQILRLFQQLRTDTSDPHGTR